MLVLEYEFLELTFPPRGHIFHIQQSYLNQDDPGNTLPLYENLGIEGRLLFWSLWQEDMI